MENVVWVLVNDVMTAIKRNGADNRLFIVEFVGCHHMLRLYSTSLTSPDGSLGKIAWMRRRKKSSVVVIIFYLGDISDLIQPDVRQSCVAMEADTSSEWQL